MAARLPTGAELSTFLSSGLEKMRSEETRCEIAGDKVKYPRPGQALIELQRSGWDSLDIDKDIGCSALNNIDASHAEDRELLELRDDFVDCAMESFLNILERRRPETLETEKDIPREVIFEFFEACNTKMGTRQFRQTLRQHLEKHNEIPAAPVREAQMDMFEVFGFEREHGRNRLADFIKNNKDDETFMAKYVGWMRTGEHAAMTAVQKYQQAGNQLADTPQAQGVSQAHFAAQKAVTEILAPMMADAKSGVEAMSPDQRGQFLKDMEPKLKHFAILSPAEKENHVKQLSHDDKVEFAKAQLLIVSLAKQEMEARQGAPSCQQMQDSGGYVPAPVAKPSQQKMM